MKPAAVPGAAAAEEGPAISVPVEDLAALTIKELAAPTGAHLFLWTSSAHLAQALE
jgi:hypothetical protein